MKNIMRKYWFLIFIPLFIFPFFGKSASIGSYFEFPLETTASIPTSTIYELGNFKIEWNLNNKQIKIFHTTEPSKVLWNTIPGTGFCGTAKGVAEFSEKAGSFKVKDIKTFLTEVQKLNSITATSSSVSFEGEAVSGIEQVNYKLTFTIKSDNQLHFKLATDNEAYNRLYLNYQCDTSEQFFGLGEQPSRFNHKGKRVPVIVQEQGIGRGDSYSDNFLINLIIGAVLGDSKGDDYTSYKSVPHYISSLSNSLFLENYEYSEFDFTQKNKVQLEVFSSVLDGNIIYAANPLNAIEEYTLYSGRMRALPDWILNGAVIGMQGGTQKAYDVWKTLKDAGTPIAAFWLQDWIGQRTTLIGKQLWWNWELDKDQYKNWNMLLDSMQNSGINIMGYINPFLVEVAGNKSNFRRNQYKEAKDNNFLILNENGSPYPVDLGSFKASIIDLSDTNCVNWIKDIIKDELIGRGLKGWMADFGEAMPFDIKLKNGDSPESYHNKYAEEWVRINREAIEEAGYGDSIVFFSRSGYSKSPKYSSLFWQGDQIVGWGQNDGLPSAVTGLLSSGLSGFSFNHSDIGGYTSIGALGITFLQRSKELLWRWMEMSAFTPVYRTHEGLGPDKNYQVYQDAETAAHFARNAKIYKAWKFYRKQLVQDASEKGIPVCRHLFLQYPIDKNTYQLSSQEFMVGSELLIAPVIKSGTNQVNVYLPAGDWVDLWTQQTINSTGQYFIISNLTNKPGVFYPLGSTIGEQFKINLTQENIY